MSTEPEIVTLESGVQLTREAYDLLGYPPPLTHADRGRIVLAAAGETACLLGYGTTDEERVGRYALQYGDINLDGTLN